MEPKHIEVRAVVRMEMLDRVIHCLKEAGVSCLLVTKVQVIGSDVDPDAVKFSSEAGSSFAQNALVQFACAGERCEMFGELIANVARTGRMGDGHVSFHPVYDVIQINTGERCLEEPG